ncbi:hypothetical protein [Streptomyces qinglanensis]|uniref:Uncharacterized protein n=1 Tax=Streptomyces qinglanensis TaxID=943816 RepID=A0A1H9UW96_9ACTN|nr:hypothetical protein [Streptomyces qinglanensis]SES13735.1 hypothetical protein SAMN05421870_109221 [Streptomyces qinglanensis]
MRLRRSLAAAALGTALGLGALTVPAHAAQPVGDWSPASAAQPGKARVDDPSYPWAFVGYYYWNEDCLKAGERGQELRKWSRYQCINGSWVPGDDYELWVIWN